MKREFHAIDRTGGLCEFELVVPNMAAENEGERCYRVAFSNALSQGVFPREKMREVMSQYDMWTEEDDKQLKEAVGQIAVLQLQLKEAETAGEDKKCSVIAKEISISRRRMWELFLVQQSVYMNSAEGVAEMIKTEAIMAACTVIKATGKRYWKDYSEFVNERDFNQKSTVYSLVVQLQSNLLDEARKDLTGDYPEYRYLKRAEERMLDREVEEKVVNIISERADKAMEDEKEDVENTVKKKVVKKRGKKVAKRVASKRQTK